MIHQYLKKIIAKRCTLLGVGPISVNCIDATVEIADDYDIPLMLIASRQQIDSEEFGGGYVNKWTTREFAEYVINRDRKGRIILARDHGGPWQNIKETTERLSLHNAMKSAKISYGADIDAGFQILHIDPSIDIHGAPGIDQILERIFELYDYCWGYAKKNEKEIFFEIGTEEQSGNINTLDELDYTLNAVQVFCRKNRIPLPLFVVIQTGSLVMETSNVGSFDSYIRKGNETAPEIQITKIAELCSRYGIYTKVHNSDYLSNEGLSRYPVLGIHAANVAPEYGVAETTALLDILETHDLSQLARRFLEISLESGKWKKWMLNDTGATDRDRSIIAGHYIFSDSAFLELKTEAAWRLRKNGIELDEYLKDSVKKSILRYIRHFGLAENSAKAN
jgi:hypothetical protein